jgi:fatty-acyl-CoA synthase
MLLHTVPASAAAGGGKQKDCATATAAELRAFLAQSLAKWQLPDAFVFMEMLRRASVEKSKKIALREQFANWNWE